MDNFLNRLAEGPRVLLMGQGYLKAETGKDLFLSQILKKYSDGSIVLTDYSALFQTDISNDPESSLAWMGTRCFTFPVPSILKAISKFKWNAVYTSSFDTIIDKAFKNEWRDVQVISDIDYIPIEPRNIKKLHIWHLFGSLTPNKNAYPPLTKQEFWSQQGNAPIMLEKLPEIVTPLGTLVIDGYNFDDDWLSAKELFPVINKLSKFQTHIFGINEGQLVDDRISYLIEEKKLVLHQETLAETFLLAEESGRLQLSDQIEEFDFDHQIKIAGKRITIPNNIWKLISNAADIIAESQYLPVKKLGKDILYSEFRNFLMDSSHKPIWEGYARKFAFEREYEINFKKMVYEKLKHSKQKRQIAILHGQTGTGKTIALGRLAYEIQKDGEFPIIFIERAVNWIKWEAIDKFCEWAENEGAKRVLIIWDGMQLPSEYYDLLVKLDARGRKVFLVGSCYTLNENDYKDVIFYKSPSNLDSEIEAFKRFLSSFDKNLEILLKSKFAIGSDSFLAFLFRVLPPTRNAIRVGLEQELDFIENNVCLFGSNALKESVRTLFGEMLIKAGITTLELDLRSTKEIANEEVSIFKKLIGLIMVPGQYNLYSPFEMVVRSFDDTGYYNLSEMFKKIDIFRWREDTFGNILITARTSLEATLIVQQRIGGARFEIDYVLDLLDCISLKSLFKQHEINFAIDLIKNFGPNSRKASYYSPYFINIADQLRRIRIDKGIENPRLMLQESMLYREASKSIEDVQTKFSTLEKAEKVIIKALEDRSVNQNRPFHSQLLVEIASIYGQFEKYSEHTEQKLKYLSLANEKCHLAHSLDTQNFYAIDVIAWASLHLLKTGSDLDKAQSFEIKKNILHAFNIADSEDYPSEALERLNNWKIEFFDLIGESKLSDDAFEKLLEIGSTTGIYIRCIKNVITFLYNDAFSDEERKLCENALQFLNQYKKLIEKDSQCLYLKLRIWFAWKTGHQFISGERLKIALDNNGWNEFKVLLTDLTYTEEFEENLRIKYYIGLANFQLLDFLAGFEQFKEIECISQFYRNRIIRHNIWCDKNGRPILFNGIVRWIDPKGLGEVEVSEIQRRIPFMVHDTGLSQINVGDSLNEFKIAFNMRGPIADFRN